VPNWCDNDIEVTGPVEDIVCFKQTCFRLNDEGEQCFDFDDTTQSAIFKDEPEYCQFWFRTPGPVPVYENRQRCFPAYIST
jgi:hypothetical protein